LQVTCIPSNAYGLVESIGRRSWKIYLRALNRD
jgi:hypothetical protein